VIDFDLRQTIESITQLLAPQAHGKGLELAVLFQHDVPDVVVGDPGRLRQILTNLLGNAIKYTDQGEVVLTVRVADQAAGNAVIRFEVRDTGPGIAPDVQADLFQPFYQVDSSPSRKQAGTGLGLAICRQLVELMGGEIGVESAPGQGSLFWFTVPMARRLEASLSWERLSRNLAGLRVLVVGDDIPSRSILMEQVIGWDMRCVGVGVGDGEEALDELHAAARRQEPYQVAILDVRTPELDELPLAAAIKADTALAQTELILLSALGHPDQAAQARELGVAGYLTKPVRQSQLYDCIALVMSETFRGLRSQAKTAVPMITRHSLAEARGRARPRVLVVENNVVNQKVAVGLINKLGCRADLATNGREALEAMRRTGYALVLMDCHMPEMDGFATAAEIRRQESRRRRTPIIAMTASTMPGDREHCLQAGMDDYVAKPVHVEALRALLKRWLPSSSRRAEESPPAAPAARTRAAVARRPAAASAPEVAGEARESPGARDSAGPESPLRRPDAKVAHLMPHFIRSAPARLAALRQAAAQGDSRALERAAHSLKGDCSYVGLPRLHALCTGLIALARLGVSGEINTYVDIIEHELAQTSKEYERQTASA
jgi:CheY-like chemotaxis protein/HPt (histidine-containing phosphotransfer) domain-containing protein